MGARITAFLTINHPDRVRSAVIAGMAGNIFKGVDNSETIASALLTDKPDEIAGETEKAFRMFAEAYRQRLAGACSLHAGGSACVIA